MSDMHVYPLRYRARRVIEIDRWRRLLLLLDEIEKLVSAFRWFGYHEEIEWTEPIESMKKGALLRLSLLEAEVLQEDGKSMKGASHVVVDAENGLYVE